jgi:hypothetical protein
MIVELAQLRVRVATLRHRTLVERRVEIVLAGWDEPVISLAPDDARVLGYQLRRHAEDADRT